MHLMCQFIKASWRTTDLKYRKDDQAKETFDTGDTSPAASFPIKIFQI